MHADDVDPVQPARFERWLFNGLALLLIIAPLHLGSNRDWAVGLLAIGVSLLLPLSWIAVLRSGHSPLVLLRRGRLPLLLLAAFASLLALQWQAGPVGWLFLSVDPYRTLEFLVRTLTYGGVFALVLLLVRNSQRIRSLVVVVVVSGVLQAFLAIYLVSIGAHYRFMYEDIVHSTTAIGTFINRNHLAGYLCLCLSLGTGLLVGSLSGRRSDGTSLRETSLGVLRFITSPRMGLRLALIVMVIALVMTRSRMGNFAFFASLIVLGSAVAVTVPALRWKALLMVASMVVVDIVVVGQLVGLDRVMTRLDGTALAKVDQRTEETVEQRLDAAWLSLPMIAKRPLVGSGGGTYFTSFPAHKTRQMAMHRWYFDHAHNDYVEIAADTGLLGLALLAGVVLVSLHRVRELLRSEGLPRESRGMAFAGLMAVSYMLLHSAVDFNLQIPANAMLFTTILALIWAAPDDDGRRRVPPSSRAVGWLGAARARLLGRGSAPVRGRLARASPEDSR